MLFSVLLTVPKICEFGCVAFFRVCFGALLEGNKEHLKTQHTRKRRISGVFVEAAFLGVLRFRVFSSDKKEHKRNFRAIVPGFLGDFVFVLLCRKRGKAKGDGSFFFRFDHLLVTKLSFF